MQFKTFSWTLIVLASGTGSIYASPAAIGTLHERDTAIARADCNWCECFTALAGEGVACAAAILEGGCNILADISCILDATAFAMAVPTCIACVGIFSVRCRPYKGLILAGGIPIEGRAREGQAEENTEQPMQRVGGTLPSKEKKNIGANGG
ncbi:hypothetical protein B0H13DRAFT_1900760 [Mycena leptocephala]|nr:hypothetical protein B0H13DRAFT_1900760 [Mycena leptocephala]